MNDAMLRSVLKSQYHASLAMLRDAIERCPPEEWLSNDHKNACWQLSYHTLFYVHLYLQRDEAAFRLWEKHHGEGDGTRGGAVHASARARILGILRSPGR